MRVPIPPQARRGTLLLVESGESFELNLGNLDPVDTPRGAQARLRQMGAYFGAVDGSMGEDFVMALKAFQTSRGLAATGELDASTQSALRETFTG